MDWSCLPLARSTLHVFARLGFEPRACDGGLTLRVPHHQRLGREVCAAALEPLPLLLLLRTCVPDDLQPARRAPACEFELAGLALGPRLISATPEYAILAGSLLSP